MPPLSRIRLSAYTSGKTKIVRDSDITACKKHLQNIDKNERIRKKCTGCVFFFEEFVNCEIHGNKINKCITGNVGSVGLEICIQCDYLENTNSCTDCHGVGYVPRKIWEKQAQKYYIKQADYNGQE